MKRRYNGLDLMKVFAAYFVVCAHVISNALDRINFLNASGELVKDFSYYFFTALRIFCTWAVPMFIMASGAFVLASPGTKDYRKFYGKAKGRILVPTVVFSIIYSIVYPCLYYFMGQFKEDGVRGALNMALTNLAKGAPAEHMWYMFTLIVLYLMAPFVVSMREMLGERNFAVAAVLLTVWGSIDNLASPPVLYWDLGFGANMLGIFMLGYVIRQWIGQEENGKKAALFILGGVAAGALQVVFKETLPVGTLYFVLSGKFPYAPLNFIIRKTRGVHLLDLSRASAVYDASLCRGWRCDREGIQGNRRDCSDFPAVFCHCLLPLLCAGLVDRARFGRKQKNQVTIQSAVFFPACGGGKHRKKSGFPVSRPVRGGKQGLTESMQNE